MRGGGKRSACRAQSVLRFTTCDCSERANTCAVCVDVVGGRVSWRGGTGAVGVREMGGRKVAERLVGGWMGVE